MLQLNHFPETTKYWNAFPGSVISSAEVTEDCVAKFTSLVRTRDYFPSSQVSVKDFLLDLSSFSNSVADAQSVAKDISILETVTRP